MTFKCICDFLPLHQWGGLVSQYPQERFLHFFFFANFRSIFFKLGMNIKVLRGGLYTENFGRGGLIELSFLRKHFQKLLEVFYTLQNFIKFFGVIALLQPLKTRFLLATMPSTDQIILIQIFSTREGRGRGEEGGKKLNYSHKLLLFPTLFLHRHFFLHRCLKFFIKTFQEQTIQRQLENYIVTKRHFLESHGEKQILIVDIPSLSLVLFLYFFLFLFLFYSLSLPPSFPPSFPHFHTLPLKLTVK